MSVVRANGQLAAADSPEEVLVHPGKNYMFEVSVPSGEIWGTQSGEWQEYVGGSWAKFADSTTGEHDRFWAAGPASGRVRFVVTDGPLDWGMYAVKGEGAVPSWEIGAGVLANEPDGTELNPLERANPSIIQVKPGREYAFTLNGDGEWRYWDGAGWVVFPDSGSGSDGFRAVIPGNGLVSVLNNSGSVVFDFQIVEL